MSAQQPNCPAVSVLIYFSAMLSPSPIRNVFPYIHGVIRQIFVLRHNLFDPCAQDWNTQYTAMFYLGVTIPVPNHIHIVGIIFPHRSQKGSQVRFSDLIKLRDVKVLMEGFKLRFGERILEKVDYIFIWVSRSACSIC